MRRSRFKRMLYLFRQGTAIQAGVRYLQHKLAKQQPGLINQVEISSIVPDSVRETILESPNANLDGNVSPDELRVICRLVKHFQPATILEIGTFDGRTTSNMAANSSEETRIFTLDLPPQELNQTALRLRTSDAVFILKDQSGREFFHRQREGTMITQLYGDSADFDYSPYRNNIDLVFVDGSHSYEYVINDTEVALSLLRNGKGIILWHDYGRREVVRALNELYLAHSQLTSLAHIAGTSLGYVRI